VRAEVAYAKRWAVPVWDIRQRLATETKCRFDETENETQKKKSLKKID